MKGDEVAARKRESALEWVAVARATLARDREARELYAEALRKDVEQLQLQPEERGDCQ